MSHKKRVIAYIDGFNMYHPIANNLPARYKWLNYRKLVESFLGANDILVDIIFFTAEPKWNPKRLIRHRNYMKALAAHLHIHIVSGNYTNVKKNFNGKTMPVISPKDARVSPEKFIYETHEEKQTDVNIALAIFEGAMTDAYDKALIFSGDSDIAPGILKSRKYKKDKRFVSILPLGGQGMVIQRSCHKQEQVTRDILDNCLLDDIIEVYGTIITNPY